MNDTLNVKLYETRAIFNMGINDPKMHKSKKRFLALVWWARN